MCGICGICESKPDAQPDPTVLSAMTDSMRHRGPDDRGTHIRGCVGLGHRRLSIIDLHGGAQPMTLDDGGLVVVFNGEIYNYIELMRDLESRGASFVTRSDTEVILHAYRQWGPMCVEKFNGMFSLAIWDERERSLCVARDRLGKKPLYYHLAAGRLIFASEMKAILRHPEVGREINLAALDEYLAHGYVPRDRCIIAGVNKLPPGHTLKWRDGRIETASYWKPRFSETPPQDERAWIEELEERMRESVRIRLRSDVPLGIFLSGGVDSSAIVALASQESASQLKTFAIGFDEQDFDELKYARMVAERFDTEHEEIIVRDQDLDVLPELVYHLDEPFADPSALPTYYVCREARRHVTVCLSGDGADEVFAGYSRYRHAQDQARWDGITALGVRQLCGVMTQVYPRRLRGRATLEQVATHGADRYAFQLGVFDAIERRALFHPGLVANVVRSSALFESYFSHADDRALTTALQHADQENYLPDDILVKVDRCSMQNSLEVRSPFLDHRVVEFVNKLPADWKLRGGVGKYVLKKMLAPYLPEEVLHRRKMGFALPIKHWFRGRQTAHVRDLLLSPDSLSLRWLRRETVARLLDDHQHGRRDLSQKIWTLLIFEHWCRKYL